MPATDERDVLANLMQLYLHDMSEFDGVDVARDGRYAYRYFERYWREPGRHPFIVRADGQIAGFALVRQHAPDVYQVAEFFILRKYRRRGVGARAARHLFDRFTGTWQVAEEDANRGAQAFWRRVIGEYTNGAFREERSHEPDGPDGPMQVFQSR